MSIGEPTIKSTEIKPVKVEQEVPIETEKSPEEIENEMLAESEKEVASFERGEKSDLESVEKKASVDGLQIDTEDRSELEGLNKEAQEAKAELEKEISGEEQEENDKKLEEKFGGFVKNRKEFYREIDVDATEEALYSKKNALQDVESIEGYMKEHLEKIGKLREEIDNKKSKIISRILEFRQIKKLEKGLASQENMLEDYKKRLVQKKELVDAYDYLIIKEERMAVLMEEAQKENVSWDENKRLELIKEEDDRDVTKLAKKHRVFFVHDIVTADWKPSANNRAINTQNLNFEDQLNITMGLEPTISISTLSPDSKNGTFGDGAWGVLLSGGRILGGNQSDAGSVAMGLKNRRIPEHFLTTKAIEKAIERPDGGGKFASSGYNELIIEVPEVAGVYFKYGDYFPELKAGIDISLEGIFDGHRLTEEWWDRLESSIKTGSPIFVIDSRNNVRMVYDINIKNKSFKVTPEYDPENLTNMPGVYKQHLGTEEKRKAVMRVFDKVTGLIPEDERKKYVPDGTEEDSRGLYNVH